MAIKGISLATQTIVLLIISAIILGSVLVFYMNTTNPSQKGFTDVAEQTMLCQKQVRYDPRCSTPLPTGTPYARLLEICTDFKYEKCQPLTSEVECIRQCCANFCGGI